MPKNLMRNLSLIVGLILLASFFIGKYVKSQGTLPEVQGSLLSPTEELADFTLETAQGQTFTKQQLLGKWSILSFGFTHCPNVCPTTLGYFRDELNALPEDSKPNTQFIFVSVDPERDTSQRLASYAQGFHPDIIALRGSIPELQKVAKIFHAYFRKEDPTPEGLYNLAHSPQYFLINPEGKWQILYTPPLNKGVLALDLTNLNAVR